MFIEKLFKIKDKPSFTYILCQNTCLNFKLQGKIRPSTLKITNKTILGAQFIV